MVAWRRAAVVLLAGGATVAAALATSVTLPEAGRTADPGDLLPESLPEPEPEALGAFLESRRWGVFAEEKPEEPPPAEEPALNPALARMGLVDLQISQQLSEARPTAATSLVGSPTVLNRQISTSLTLRDGGSLVMGGSFPATRAPASRGSPSSGGCRSSAGSSAPTPSRRTAPSSSSW